MLGANVAAGMGYERPDPGSILAPRMEDFEFRGGAWEVRRGLLFQFDTNDKVRGEAFSRYSLPQNPSFALRLRMLATPPDWSTETHPPFLRVKFGERWEVMFHSQSGAGLWRLSDDGSHLSPVMELPVAMAGWRPRGGEVSLLVRCGHDHIAVSLDSGWQWCAYRPGDEALRVAAAPFSIEGQGGIFGFGVGRFPREV